MFSNLSVNVILSLSSIIFTSYYSHASSLVCAEMVQNEFARDIDGSYILATADKKIQVKTPTWDDSFDPLEPYLGYPGELIKSDTPHFDGVGEMDAFCNTKLILDFLDDEFQHDGIDGKEMNVEVILYDDDTAQFQAPNYILLGRNLHKGLKPTSSFIDLVAHEIFHGILRSTSGLSPRTLEAAGLNEGLADSIGIFLGYKLKGLEKPDYNFAFDLHGDQRPLRSISNPQMYGLIDHYQDLDSGDNSGHINGGILSLVFYLFAEGGSHPRLRGEDIQGVGIDLAAKIFFEFSTTLLDPDSTFHDARVASMKVAKKYGVHIEESLSIAWDQVGVY